MLRTAAVLGAITLVTALHPAMARDVMFAGRSWTVRTSGGVPTGPGPNLFSSSGRVVTVDESGALHLTITRAGEQWLSTEVILKQSLGYGTYRFDIAPGATHIADNAVLGLFTYDDDPAENSREVDIELSRWNDGRTDNLQCSVQPADQPELFHRFALPENGKGWSMQFTWAPGSFDCAVTDMENGQVIGRGRVTSGVPTPGNEKTRINLWQFRGAPPSNRQPSEVVIRDFTFTPLGDNAAKAEPAAAAQP